MAACAENSRSFGENRWVDFFIGIIILSAAILLAMYFHVLAL